MLELALCIIFLDLLHECKLIVVSLLTNLANNNVPVLDHGLREGLSREVPLEELALLDEVLTIGGIGCLLDLAIFRFEIAVEYVLQDGVVEHDGLLEDKGELLSQLVEAVSLDVLVVDKDLAEVRVVEAE